MKDNNQRERLRDAVRYLGLPEKERELAFLGIDQMSEEERATALEDVSAIKRLLPNLALPSRPKEQGRPVPNERKLVVGIGILFSGEITACDRMVVEGAVQANLANCRGIEIARTGVFKGSASVDEAEVRGRFQGTLVVRHRLVVRSTGKVFGKIHYGQIEIECGGEISGELESATDQQQDDAD